MYEPVKQAALSLLKAPSEPPTPPAGSHDSVETFRASPRYLSYRMLRFWLHAAFVVLVESVLLVVLAVSREPGIAVAAVLGAVILVVPLALQYFAIRIDYDLRHYIVTDRAVRVRQGAWIVQEMTITHANVQNLRVVQGPLERLFRFSTLEIDTAGGGGGSRGGEGHGVLAGHTVRMAGIENAAAIRDRILAHLRARGGGAGLGDFDDEPDHAGTPARSEVAAVGVAGSDAGGGELVAALVELRDATRALRAAAARRS